jgi:hypothetical protein
MTTELNRATIFNDTKWIFYCLCEGWGIGPMSPLVQSDVKELCLHSTCGTADIGGTDGLCNMISNCLCVTEQFAFPPAAETPPCICFNKWIGTTRTEGTKSKQNIFDMKQVMTETFWIYYLFCAGCGINKCSGPLIQSEFKQLCCAGSTGMVAPVEEGIFCSAVSTELCIWSEFQLPPAPGNPKCAICTWRLSKDTATAAPNKPSMPPTTVKGPSQEEMA